MKRNELLDKLAMELAEWPVDMPPPNIPGLWSCHHEWRCQARGDANHIFGHDWLGRRTELINEPDDSEAPEWARWKGQNSDGFWWFYESKPAAGANSWVIYTSDIGFSRAAKGELPAGHDWTKTLTDIKPMQRELNPSTSSITDSQARDYAETTGECSDGNPCGVPPRVGDDAYCADCPNQLQYNPADAAFSDEQEEQEWKLMEARLKPHEADARQLDEQLERDIAAFREVYKIAEDQDAAELGLPNSNSILNAAAQHMQDRAATYDNPQGERSMGATVDAFDAITGDGLMNTEERGWLFMQLLKAVRSQQGDYRADSYEDGAAYVALAGEAAAKHRT